MSGPASGFIQLGAGKTAGEDGRLPYAEPVEREFGDPPRGLECGDQVVDGMPVGHVLMPRGRGDTVGSHSHPGGGREHGPGKARFPGPRCPHSRVGLPRLAFSGRTNASAVNGVHLLASQLDACLEAADERAAITGFFYDMARAPYGYRASHVPHPVPAKRAKGVKKTVLVVHPVEGPVVRKMFAWRVAGRLGYQAIADRLNADLVTHPPPTPVDAGRAVGRWTSSNVRDVLTNPKHTGHMVWNRRARKGKAKNRANPVEDWVWSPEPVHEALVDLETFVQAQQVAERRQRSRAAAGMNRHPHTRRSYRLRSYLICSLCGRRMSGKTLRATPYYVCAPKKGYVPPGHPAACGFWVREDHLVDGLNTFLADRVFGAYRRDLLDANLEAATAAAQAERETRIAALRRALHDKETQSKRLVRNLALVDEPDQEFIRDINEQRSQLRAERDDIEQRLAALAEEQDQASNPALLDHLPVTAVDLAELPDDLARRLFDALRLEIHYDCDRRRATCRITLTGATAPKLPDHAVCPDATTHPR